MVILEIYVVLMATLVHVCQGTVNNSVQNTEVKCSMRYDLVTGNAKTVYNQTCQYWFNRVSFCDETLLIRYYEIPPYMSTLPDGSIDGIIPGLLKILLKTCCGMCTRLKYLKPYKKIEETRAWFFNTSSYSIMMPVLAVSKSETYFGKPFVKLMDTPGVVYVTIDNSAEEFGKKTLASIGGTWPLLVITILLTLQGGVLMWLLDQWKNPEEFPRPFGRGAVEGSWWAFISMTTVGYGDKAPRSMQGRIFAVFWITMGIAIIGMFTASLSSSLTSAAIPSKSSLEGLKIGYLRYAGMSYEENIIYKEEGTPQHFEKIHDMIEALRTNEIKGILMDSLALRYHWTEFKNSGLHLARKTDIVNSETEIGLMFSGPALQKWATFLDAFIDGNKDASSRFLREAINGMKVKHSIETATVQESQSLSQGKGYDYMLMFCACSCAVIFFIGLGFYFLRQIWLSKTANGVRNVLEMQAHKGSIEDTINQILGAVETLKGTIGDIQDELSIVKNFSKMK